MDISDIVTNAVKDAEEGVESEPLESSDSGESESPAGGTGESTSTESSGETGRATTAVSPSSGAASVETKGVAAPVVAPGVSKEDVEEFAKFGIHPPKPGQREGTFKWSKVGRVVENARKKVAEKYEKDLKEHQEKVKQLTDRLSNGDLTDRLIAADPDKYLRMLAVMHPAYQKFLSRAEGVENGRKPEPVAKPTPPPPDAEFPDGSRGYSPEGLEKLMQFHRDEAKREAIEAVKAEYENRFGPIEQDWKQSRINRVAEERQAKSITSVRSQIEASKKTWGAMFQSTNMGDKEDDPEIVKSLEEHPDWSFEACVNHVLVPRMQANRDTMRKDILAELEKAPSAASRSVATSAGGSGSGKERSIEDIVREATSSLRG